MARQEFWHSSLLYVNRPNLVNKRLLGAKILYCWSTKLDTFEKVISFFIETSVDQIHSNFKNESKTSISVDRLFNIDEFSSLILFRKLYRKQTLKTLQNSNQTALNSSLDYDLVILFPHENSLFVIPLTDFNEDSGRINVQKETFKADSELAFSLYLTGKHQGGFSIETKTLFDMPKKYWLNNVLKIKLERWMKSFPSLKKNEDITSSGSIQYVSVDTYCDHYNRLKEQYAIELREIWQSGVEKTDPVKFIYEDLAIAAYLITLWEEESAKLNLKKKQQTFADIGCGNGLLVYLLNKEGYQGYGVDIRRRNIWENFSKAGVHLIEMQIDLFDETEENCNFKLPLCDWMIGNHSDQLTPWILYISSQMSINTRAFILPCCCYDFDGLKFQRNLNSNKTSQYRSYIEYLKTLSNQLGFANCLIDKLRIPSTKRICLICFDRNYLNSIDSNQIEPLELIWNQKRRQLVREKLQKRPNQLREKKELVRNCSQIDPEIRELIIKHLTNAMFEQKTLSFEEAICLLKEKKLLILFKKQCGGLQTFVRNNQHIFTIENSRICFQRAEYLKNRKNCTVKTKPCWFHAKHPSGCPLTKDECCFKH